MSETKFIKRKTPNKKRAILLLILLIIIIFLFYNIESIIEGLFTVQE